VLAVVGDHVQPSVAVYCILSSCTVHYYFGDLYLANGARETPLGYYDGVVGSVAVDKVHTALAEAAIDKVATWPAGSDVAALFGVGKGR